jgi:outer membrane receptor protein involved in Fe transport
MQFAKEEEGTASARNRKYRANFIANYKFQEGIAKGFGVGVGVRYRSKGAIGYQGKPNEFIQSLLASEPGVVITPPTTHPSVGLQQADITKPIYGEATYDIDGWVKYERKLKLVGRPITWQLQINITNLFNDDDIVPFRADFNNVVEQWTTREPRTFALTNMFKF